MNTIELLTPDDLAAWSEPWRQLALVTGSLVFRSPAWVESWWRVFEPAARVVLLVDGPRDEPTGLLALAWLRRRVHPRVPLSIPYLGVAGSGLGAADALGPLATDPASPTRLLRRAVELAGTVPLVLDSLAPEHRPLAASLPGAVTLSSNRRPVLDLRGVEQPDELWSAKQEKNIRRRETLLRDGGFDRRWVRLDDADRGPLLELERLHNSLWESRGREGLFGPARMAFFVELCRRRDETCEPWMQLIERDGRAVGALLGFRCGSTFVSYKTGWDPSHHRLGLGVQLHSAAIRWAHERGIERYDFLRGPTAHKYALGGADDVDTTIVVPNGLRGRQLLARDRASMRRASTTAWRSDD